MTWTPIEARQMQQPSPTSTMADAPANAVTSTPPPTSVCIDWYSEGQTRVVEVNGVRVTVRFVGRNGRRARIAIEAPAGAVFRGEDR